MKIKLTGLSAELFQSSEIETAPFLTVKELKEELKRLKPGLTEMAMMVAVNDKLVEDSGRIGNKDKVLIFHPFAGG